MFGRGKEPFWQQAYTDLLKFVISLRRIAEGYTTLSEVYRYVINDSLIDRDIRDLATQFREPPEVLVVSNHDHEAIRRAPWTLWEKLGPREMAHQYRPDLEGFLAAHDISFSVRKGTSTTTRRAQRESSRLPTATWTPDEATSRGTRPASGPGT